MKRIQERVLLLHTPTRIDAYLKSVFHDEFSREEIKISLRKGEILLNGNPAKPKSLVREGDLIEGTVSSPRESSLLPEELPLNIVYEDDRSCDKVAAVTAANKLITIDHANALVGITCSSMALSVGPIAQQNHVLLMSGSASSKDVTALGDFVYRTYPSDSKRSHQIAALIKQKGYGQVAYIYDNGNPATVTSINDIQLELGSQGESYSVSSDENDFRTILTKIKSMNADVIVVGFSAPSQIVSFIKQLHELGLPSSVFTPLESIQDSSILGVAGDTEVVYAIFSEDDKNQKYNTLVQRYKRDHNGAEVPQYLAENYDGTLIVLEALWRANGNTEHARELMNTIGNKYLGASGTISFDINGDVQKPPVLMTIRAGKFTRF